VACIPIARQGLGKHIRERDTAHDNRTSIAWQRRGKHASSTIQAIFCVVRTMWLQEVFSNSSQVVGTEEPSFGKPACRDESLEAEDLT
jgi:hypothetical protein